MVTPITGDIGTHRDVASRGVTLSNFPTVKVLELENPSSSINTSSQSGKALGSLVVGLEDSGSTINSGVYVATGKSPSSPWKLTTLLVGSLPQTIPDSRTPLKDVVIQFGNNSIMVGNLNLAREGSEVPMYNTDYTLIEDSYMSFVNVNLVGDSGRGNTEDPTDDSISITNHSGLLDYSYSDSSPMSIDLSGARLLDDKEYLVKITCSRQANLDERVSSYSIGGGAPILLDSGLVPAGIVDSIVTGKQLKDYGIVASKSKYYFYFNIVQITLLN